MRSESVAKFIRQNWPAILACLIILVVVQILWGIKTAVVSVFTWIAASIGIAKRRVARNKIEKESTQDRQALVEKVEKASDDVKKEDKKIDAVVAKEAAHAPTPEQDKADVLGMLDDLKKGD